MYENHEVSIWILWQIGTEADSLVELSQYIISRLAAQNFVIGWFLENNPTLIIERFYFLWLRNK